MKYFKEFLLFTLILLSCKPSNSSDIILENEKTFKYIQKIKIEEDESSLEIFSGGTSVRFLKENLPLNSAMVIPTVVLSYLDELNSLEKVIGVSQTDYIFNQKIQQKIQNNKIQEIGVFNEIFIEKILVNKPDIFISTSGPTLSKYHEILGKEGIPILYIDEYEELNPLARAEYVKIFGKLFGKEKEAEELFNEIEKNYFEIENKIKEANLPKPTIMANQIYGDIWYVPGGRSFQAILFENSGGNYLWANTESSSTLNLSFESVFEKAGNADIWMNAGDFPDLNSLLGSYANLDWFKTVKDKKVYNWSKRSSISGANDYFEKGTARPDWVLKDLGAIFYPELFPKHELYFYKKLE